MRKPASRLIHSNIMHAGLSALSESAYIEHEARSVRIRREAWCA